MALTMGKMHQHQQVQKWHFQRFPQPWIKSASSAIERALAKVNAC